MMADEVSEVMRASVPLHRTPELWMKALRWKVQPIGKADQSIIEVCRQTHGRTVHAAPTGHPDDEKEPGQQGRY
jgi:hypothetical protein